MRHRWILGCAVASGVAAGTLLGAAPHAVAAVEVTPGINCERAGCHNDNDDMYRVDAEVLCSEGGGLVHGTAWVPAHGDATIGAACPLISGPGHWETPPAQLGPDGKFESQPPVFRPDFPQPTTPVSYRYLGAVVDNNPPPPPTGSFGF